MKNETIKAKATHLRLLLEQGNQFNRPLGKNSVKLAHCHELIAAALGFKSKVAMNNYDCDPEWWDEDEYYFGFYRRYIYSRELDLEFIMERVARLRDTPLHHVNPRFIASSLEEALAPPCQNYDCGSKDKYGRFIYDGDSDDPVMFVCEACSKDEYKYEKCLYCGSTLYKASVINRAGECPEHYGESHMDEEEREDWDSYVEYLNK
ncbi:hypothetical protein H4F17_18520 [Vibrio cholerae]